MLPTTEEIVHTTPLIPPAAPESTTVTTTVVRKHGDGDASEDKNKFIHIIRPLLVELIGTALFVLIGIWGVCANAGILVAALAFGLALMVFSASFGHISGVHFNPSVTIGVLIAGEMQPVMAILYVVMQLLGGIAAGGILRLLLRSHVYATCKGGATLLTTYSIPTNITSSNGLITYADDSVRIWEGIIMEFIVTFVFVTVIIMVALDTKSKTGLAPILIGLTLAVCMLAVGQLTGGSLNPARSLGPAIFSGRWENHFVYWIGPLVGAIIAGLLYRAVWAHNDRRLFVKRPTKMTTTTTVTKA